MLTASDLRSVRLALGLTQTALAERLGVPQATVSRWETNTHQIEQPLILWCALCHLAVGADKAIALLDSIRVREFGPSR